MNIRIKLLISYILLIIFLICILGYTIGSNAKDAVFNEVKEKNKRITELINNMLSVRNDLLREKIISDLNFAEKLIYNNNSISLNYTHKIKINNENFPTIFSGNVDLVKNNKLVKDIKNSTSAITSIYLIHDKKLVRISTTLEENNKPILGVTINEASSIYKNIINNKHYYGRILIGSNWYITGYKPILDSNRHVIGAIALGYKDLNDYLEKTINSISVGKTGYVYIMDSTGYVVVHPDIKGKNIGDFNFSKKIIKNKNGIIKYTFNGVFKLATYKYFEPWDWYIITTANYEDLKSSSISIMNTTMIVGLITLLISSFISLLLAYNLVKPINKLKNCMEIAGKGDLSIQCDVNSKDEIGILSHSFNSLIRENRRLLEETIEYDRLKTEFFSNISHELKTPLNIIFSATQLLTRYHCNNTNKTDKHLNIIKQNCYRLLKLVNNLIDITKIDSGYIELNLQNKNIVEVIEEITLSTVEYVNSKGRKIIFDTDVEEKIIAFDSEKMERIILNLISNAVKFTNAGDEISISIVDGEEDIHISVKDTGIGIPQEKQEIIFERFRQVDPLLSRRHEGSGIGLSLVKSLVEMHSGSIYVNKNYYSGTELIITIPVRTVTVDKILSVDESNSQLNIERINVEFSDIYS